MDYIKVVDKIGLYENMVGKMYKLKGDQKRKYNLSFLAIVPANFTSYVESIDSWKQKNKAYHDYLKTVPCKLIFITEYPKRFVNYEWGAYDEDIF